MSPHQHFKSVAKAMQRLSAASSITALSVCTVVLAWLPAPALALQVLQAQDGQTLVAKVSRREITRIAVQDGRIHKVTGNAGEFLLERDEARGEVFLRPADPDRTRPINLFVTTDRGTVALLLQPLDVPSDTVLIRHPAPLATRQTPSPPRSNPPPSAAAHLRTLKDLLLVMADGLLPPDLSYEEVGVDVPLWVDTSFHLLRRWRGDALVGESYRLTNTGNEALEIAEQHLHRPGYLAIGIEQSRLQSGQSTAVHVIRRRTASE